MNWCHVAGVSAEKGANRFTLEYCNSKKEFA